MAATGRFIAGYVPDGSPVWMWEVPFECLDRCICNPHGARHKRVNGCACRIGYRCASHIIFVDIPRRVYNPDEPLFANDDRFEKFK